MPGGRGERLRFTPGVSTVAALALLACAPGASADTFRPNKTSDHAPGACTGQDCTLREAITAANSLNGKDVVILRAGKAYKVTLDPGIVEDANAAADLDVTADLTIKARGDGYAVLDAKRKNRVLDVAPQSTADVTIRDLWIRNGFSTASGAGIRAGAGGATELTLAHSRVTGSKVASTDPGGGVAIANQASGSSTARISNTTISGNKAAGGSGGGLAAVDTGLVTIDDSTISDNRAGNGFTQGSGGGVFMINNLTAVEITNSTLADNRASSNGGGISSFDASLTLEHATVARNLADSDGNASGVGGGVEIATGSGATVRNSILALNRSSTKASRECVTVGSVAFASEGRDLFATSPSGCPALDAPPNLVQRNPHLGALASHGGPTETIALEQGSKAIDHAQGASPARDQRGVKRDSKPDIGAYER